MEEEKEIGIISLSFASGIVASCLVGKPYLTALVSSVLSALCLTSCILRKGGFRLMIPLLFLALGVMCQSTEALTGGYFKSESALEAICGKALTHFRSAITRCGFGNIGTEGLVTALLTGCRDGLDRDTVSNFRKSGASHILALSGLHLGVIYAILSKFLALVGNSPGAKFISKTIILCCCGFYTVMTGASSSTQRAFLFILANELSRSQSGRTHNARCTFCLALTVQLAISPSAVTTAGFQLSYLAMLGILIIYPELESWYPETGDYYRDKFNFVKRIWSSMALSISCQVLTAPVAWWHFRSFPVNFLLTNLIALPLTEALITIAVTAVALTALDICPDIVVRLADLTAGSLEFCLEVIASI